MGQRTIDFLGTWSARKEAGKSNWSRCGLQKLDGCLDNSPGITVIFPTQKHNYTKGDFGDSLKRKKFIFKQ